MKKLILPLLIAALVLPFTASACPGGGPGKGGSHFTDMDSNGDGTITADEHATAAAKRFAEMDANGDGKVTRDEMKQHWQQMRDNWQGNCPRKQDCPNGMNCPRKQGS